MSEEAKKLKRLRQVKLSAFTRKQGHVQGLIDRSASIESLNEAIDELKEAFKAIEDSHDEYVAAVDEVTLQEEGDYLALPAVKLETMKSKTRELVKKLSTTEKGEASKAKFKIGLDNFGTPSQLLKQLSTENRISLADMKAELEKVEKTYDLLKVDMMALDPASDVAALLDRYNKDVATEVEECKKIALQYRRDVGEELSVAAVAEEGSRASSGARVFSTTKRETVMLPHFSGDEKSAYLKYPVWKKQWEEHIQEYEEKYRATMLLSHLDDKAQLQIVGLETNYDEAIKQLDSYYNDSKKVIRACLDEIRAQPQVSQYDYKGLVQYKKCLINNHARLQACNLLHEMSNTAAMGVIIRKFPIQEAVDFQKFLSEQTKENQNSPFPSFITWLNKIGTSWELLAASGTGVKGKSGVMQVHHTFFGDETTEGEKNKKACFRCGQEGHLKRDCQKKEANRTGGGKNSNSNSKKPRNPPKHKRFHCAFHKDAADRYCYTWSCPSVKYTQYGDRIKLLKENLDCEICCGDCPKGNCLAKTKRVCGGNKEGRGCGTNHIGHELWCSGAKLCFTVSSEMVMRSADEAEDGVLLQVMKIPSVDKSVPFEVALWDTACTGLFVRTAHAKRMGFPCQERRLRVCTLGGDVKEIDGLIFQCEIVDRNGNRHSFTAHGLDEVTGSLNTMLSDSLMKRLFPNVIGAHRMCGAQQVDYLIGLGKASWQPTRSIQAAEGGDFWIWENEFGSCVGGSHPLVGNRVSRSDSLYTVLKVVELDDGFSDSLKIPTCSAYLSKTSVFEGGDFFQTEQLCTIVEPRCGSCRCGKCPVPGSRYSFREETELQIIDESLRYDESNGRWIARYPLLFPRHVLKGSKAVAMKSLQSTERMLSKNKQWGEVYDEQIQDMVVRGAARVVSPEELTNYSGTVNYLPHLAVKNPRSESTPVRIVFDASRSQGGGPSLNAVLAKGPDRYINNLAGVIIRFRDGVFAVKGDVRKMHNCVALEEEDCFLQCFLWRNLDTKQDPTTYQVVVNNIGVKPAGCIASLSLYKSADRFKERFPTTAHQLKRNSYVDDLGLTGGSKAEILMRVKEANEILAHANMSVKNWIFSGDDEEVGIGEIGENLPLEESGAERMLGVVWNPKEDAFKFKLRINLSEMKKKIRMGPDLSKEDLKKNPPTIVTRRQYYSQVQSLFDPVGFLSPVLLRAKILLRKTWEDNCAKLGWDEPLPAGLVEEIVKFFIELFDLESISFPRSLWPKQEEVVGHPELVVFSDGSITAFGSVAYIRWKLSTGKWWSTIVISKSKIAPKSRITVPRLELNGAVLGKRIKEFVLSDLDLEFARVHHLVDSSTVLGYLHKADAKLKPYEGVRVSEIQTAGKFTEGRLHDWSWVESHNNPADWATKPRLVQELREGGFWQKGPNFLQEDVEYWPIKRDFRTDKLEGEIQPKGVFTVVTTVEACRFLEDLERKYSSSGKLYRIVAYVYKWLNLSKKVDTARVPGVILKDEILKAKSTWIRFGQRNMEKDLGESVVHIKGKSVVDSRYKRLAPFKDTDDIWRVGIRVREFVPFTEDNKPPALLPRESKLTHILMREAHETRHSGVSSTVGQFRLNGFWVPQANRLAKKVKQQCIMCRRLDLQPIKQIMGSVPKERLVNPVAWGHIELDLFGPFICKSDVNKRATKKVWGMLIVDVNSGAVHCDTVQDYGTQEVVITLTRFANLRGWPLKISSDPGSQLQGASGNMSGWWSEMESGLVKSATKNGFTWDIRPANSPWRQGTAEVSIKAIKRLLKIAVGDIKLTPSELQSAMFEAANLCNGRPIGINKYPAADGAYQILTPNCLIMGRSRSEVPDHGCIAENLKKADRFKLIEQVTLDFWKRWTTEVTPEYVLRQRWHQTGRDLKVGDVVLVHDSSALKGQYKMAKVEEIKTSSDGRVRSCQVSYRIPYSKDDNHKYSGGKVIKLSRSVQRLTLLLPVEEQNDNLVIHEDKVIKEEQSEDLVIREDKVIKEEQSEDLVICDGKSDA